MARINTQCSFFLFFPLFLDFSQIYTVLFSLLFTNGYLLTPVNEIMGSNVLCFVCLSVILSTEGCNHYPWCIGPHCTGSPTPTPQGMGPHCIGLPPWFPWTWDLTVMNLSSVSDILWTSLEICSNLFTSLPQTIWWLLKHIRLVQVGGTHHFGMLSCSTF